MKSLTLSPVPVQLTRETALACVRLGVPGLSVLNSEVRGAPDKVAALYWVTRKAKAALTTRAEASKITLCDYVSLQFAVKASKATLSASDFDTIASGMRAKASGKAVRE